MRAFCTNTPAAAGGSSGPGAPGPAYRTSKGRMTGSPNQRRRARTSSTAGSLDPGAGARVAGVKVISACASGSTPTSRTGSVVLPALCTVRWKTAFAPPVTVRGSTSIVVRGWAGTSTTVSSTTT